MVLVALCLLLSVSKPLKPGSMLKVNSKHGTDVWTPTESADAHSVFGSIWTRSSMSRRQKTRRAEVESKRSVSWPGSNGSNERATLKCKESTEHRGKDLCIWRPALSGSYSLPLLTDAVCFSLCLALPWKTIVATTVPFLLLRCLDFIMAEQLYVNHNATHMLFFFPSPQAVVGKDYFPKLYFYLLIRVQFLLEVDGIQPEVYKQHCCILSSVFHTSWLCHSDQYLFILSLHFGMLYLFHRNGIPSGRGIGSAGCTATAAGRKKCNYLAK